MTYQELITFARESGAKDPDHVCQIARLAISRGDEPADVLRQIRNSQPRLFYSTPAKPKRKP